MWLSVIGSGIFDLIGRMNICIIKKVCELFNVKIKFGFIVLFKKNIYMYCDLKGFF